MPSLSLVIPMYNEQENVMPLLERVHEALADYAGPWEVLLIDDGSVDHMVAQIRQGVERFGNHMRPILLRLDTPHG